MDLSMAGTDSVYESETNKKIYFRDIDEGLRNLAEKVKESNPGLLRFCDIGDIDFAMVEGDKTSYLAKAVRVAPIHRLFNGRRKFIILFNLSHIEATSSAKWDLIMLHELMHCDTDMDKIVEHDIEDFSLLLERFGIRWTSNPDSAVLVQDTIKNCIPWAYAKKDKEKEEYNVDLKKAKKHVEQESTASPLERLNRAMGKAEDLVKEADAILKNAGSAGLVEPVSHE